MLSVGTAEAEQLDREGIMNITSVGGLRPALVAAALLGCGTACAPAPDAEALDTATDASESSPPSTWATEEEARSCEVGPEDLGSWFGILPADVVSAQPLEHDSGLSAAVAHTPEVDYQYAAIDLLIESAVVTMVGEDPSADFWVEDGLIAVRARLESPLAEPLTPGDVISFVAKSVRAYEGQTHLSLVGTLVLEESGHPVPVREATDGVDHSSHGSVVHHAWGEVVEQLEGCPGYTCFDVDTPRGLVEVWLPGDRGAVPGDCVEVVSPLATDGERSFVHVPIWDQFRFY